MTYIRQCWPDKDFSNHGSGQNSSALTYEKQCFLQLSILLLGFSLDALFDLKAYVLSKIWNKTSPVQNQICNAKQKALLRVGFDNDIFPRYQQCFLTKQLMVGCLTFELRIYIVWRINETVIFLRSTISTALGEVIKQFLELILKRSAIHLQNTFRQNSDGVGSWLSYYCRNLVREHVFNLEIRKHEGLPLLADPCSKLALLVAWSWRLE